VRRVAPQDLRANFLFGQVTQATRFIDERQREASSLCLCVSVVFSASGLRLPGGGLGFDFRSASQHSEPSYIKEDSHYD
jgi:hypothetical protein